MVSRPQNAGIDQATVLSSIHDANANQWNNLVTQSERGTMFHRHEWLAAIEAGFDFVPSHALVRRGGNPIALMPNFVSRLRPSHGLADSVATWFDVSVMTSTYPGYGGPLAGADEDESVDRLLDAIETTNRGRVLYHVVQTYDLAYTRYGKYLQSRGYEPMSDGCLFIIDLTEGWEPVFERMAKERRKAIRRANEQDFHVELSRLSEGLQRTYEHYAKNMDRVDGKRFPRTFFDALGEAFDERVLVFTAVVDGEEVGRYVHLLDRENAVLHHWLSAIPDESCFEAYPSELLHERAIKWGIEHGFADYNFGITGAHFDDSVFRFKEKYGGRTIPLLRWQKGHARLMWPLFKLGRSKYMNN